jgi:hypothetical protein
MFRPTAVIISTAVQNVLIGYSTVVLTEMISGVSVVCEWIEWLIVVEIWWWFNEVYVVYNIHTVHNVHN